MPGRSGQGQPPGPGGPTQFSVYLRNAAGRWQYWTASPYFSPAGQWTKAGWRTPPVPAGSYGLSFGLSAFANGTLATRGYRFGPAPARTVQALLARAALFLVLLGAAAEVGRGLVRRRRAGEPGRAGTRHPAGAAGAGGQAREPPARSSSSR
jgi:hypothetical protein